jgi:monovalent cation/hydrogen antiporter
MKQNQTSLVGPTCVALYLLLRHRVCRWLLSPELFSFRAEIILIAFMVILVTLVLQDLSLPLLIRTLDLVEDRSTGQEERQARELAAMAALALLDEVASEDWPVQKHIEQLLVHYGRRRQRYADVEATNAECTKEVAEAFRRLRHETLTAERLTVINLWKDGTISDEILHRLEHELDVEALRIGIGGLRAPSGQSVLRTP